MVLTLVGHRNDVKMLKAQVKRQVVPLRRFKHFGRHFYGLQGYTIDKENIFNLRSYFNPYPPVPHSIYFLLLKPPFLRLSNSSMSCNRRNSLKPNSEKYKIYYFADGSTYVVVSFVPSCVVDLMGLQGHMPS